MWKRRTGGEIRGGGGEEQEAGRHYASATHIIGMPQLNAARILDWQWQAFPGPIYQYGITRSMHVIPDGTIVFNAGGLNDLLIVPYYL